MGFSSQHLITSFVLQGHFSELLHRKLLEFIVLNTIHRQQTTGDFYIFRQPIFFSIVFEILIFFVDIE
jgi:hypothetical protein